MGTDRELLEAAAKAAGMSYVHDLGVLSHDDYNEFVRWNPLTDDGDALRLAVRLGMDVCFGANYVIVRGSVQTPTVNNAGDPYAATRRAIVRAAAEIGKGLRPFPSDEEIRENWT
jgi:hypothetical protein